MLWYVKTTECEFCCNFSSVNVVFSDELQSQLSEHFTNLQTSSLHVGGKCSIASESRRFIHHTGSDDAEDTADVQSSALTSAQFVKSSDDSATDSVNHVQCCNRCLNLSKDELEKHTIVYIGQESMVLSNVLLLWHQCQIYSCNPVTNTCRLEGLQSNRALMKRYYLVEKAKDARIVGVVAGTLGVANYLEVRELAMCHFTCCGAFEIRLSLQKCVAAKCTYCTFSSTKKKMNKKKREKNRQNEKQKMNEIETR